MPCPDAAPRLSDGVLTLRAATPEDADGLHELCNDPKTRRWTAVPVPFTAQQAADAIAEQAARWADGTGWGFTVQADAGVGPGHYAGTVRLRGRGGIGHVEYAAHPAVRDRGVMTRAVRLLCDWAFEDRRLAAVRWTAQAGNLAAWRVAWAAGFGFEGTSRASVPQRGEARDGWHACLLAGDTREPTTRWLDLPRLVGDRVVLRALRADDEERFLQATNDPASVHWFTTVPGFPRDATGFAATLARRRLDAALGRALSWALADPGTDSYLGTLNVFGIGGLDYGSAELGYWAHPGARGRGVVSQAVRLAVAHAFTAEADGGLGLQRLSILAGEGNTGSQRVARAAGFTETGRDRRCYDLPDGRVVDVVRFDLLDDQPGPASA